MANAQKKETSIVTVKDIYFVYSSVSEPRSQLNPDNKPMMSDHELEGHSYQISILMPEERFKSELKREFKGAKNFPNAKEYSPEECEEQFGIFVEDDMVSIKFSQTCLTGKASNRVPTRPITQIGIKGKVQDINGATISQDTNLGYGTKGHFQFNPYHNEKNGLYLYPHLVCVTELVEYAGGGSAEDLDSLGLEELDTVDVTSEAVVSKEEFEDPNF
tara:strand:- start:1740 stop:2390 length:651 start_codon:yes stop_codon:yes gene_type:complete